jgi:hypothetical protein
MSILTVDSLIISLLHCYHCSLSHTHAHSISLSFSLSSNTFYIDSDTAKRTNTAEASTCLAKPFCQESLHKGSRPYCMSAKIYHHCLQTLNNHHHQCKQNLNNVWKNYKYILGHKWDLAATQPIFEQIRHWCHISVVWLKDNSWKQPNAGKGVLVKTWKHDASINPKSVMASHADVPTGIFLPLELKAVINTKVWSNSDHQTQLDFHNIRKLHPNHCNSWYQIPV